jgi:hypothetical protein
MNCNAVPATAPAIGSLDGSTPAGAVKSALAKFNAIWNDQVQRSNKARAQAAFADIDAHTLRDIGAPNWIIAEAVQRGDSRGLRLIDLYRS